MDDTTSSRTQGLKTTFAHSQTLLQPVLTYINGDVSWLVSFPRPASQKSNNNKSYYHAVIDPWFGQPCVLVSSYLLGMQLGRAPGLPNRAAIDTAITDIELAAGNIVIPTDINPAVDGIFITGIVEHCHKESLIQFCPSTPIFAVPAPANTISTWSHFDTVVKLPPFDPSKTFWKEGHPGAPLPAWLTVFNLAVTQINNFGMAFITSAYLSDGESILMAPHGIYADESSVKGLIAAGTKMLALVAPLKDSYVLGLKQICNIADSLVITQAGDVRYYVRSGDFVSLKYKGVLGWSVRDVQHDLEWGVEQFRKKSRDESMVKAPTLVEVENGGSYVLV